MSKQAKLFSFFKPDPASLNCAPDSNATSSQTPDGPELSKAKIKSISESQVNTKDSSTNCTSTSPNQDKLQESVHTKTTPKSHEDTESSEDDIAPVKKRLVRARKNPSISKTTTTSSKRALSKKSSTQSKRDQSKRDQSKRGQSKRFQKTNRDALPSSCDEAESSCSEFSQESDDDLFSDESDANSAVVSEPEESEGGSDDEEDTTISLDKLKGSVSSRKTPVKTPKKSTPKTPTTGNSLFRSPVPSPMHIDETENPIMGAATSLTNAAAALANRARLGHSWGFGRTKLGYSPDLTSERARAKYGIGGTKINDDTAKRGGLYTAGEHFHDTLPWLYEDRRDAQGRLQSDVNFNPRTIHVPPEFLASKQFCTPAGRQWWEFKRNNMDTVLCFKQGKFYELFHMDADILVRELDCIYMKGFSAHGGFPETAYGRFSEQLVANGYRVARIEQTETPQQLAERKKRTKGPKPQVVNRELCGIKSKGTKIFSHLDLSETNSNNCGSGWLYSIREYGMRDESSSDATQTHQEDNVSSRIGICAIHTASSEVVLAEFMDDTQRGKLRAMLARLPAAEIVCPRGELTNLTQKFLRFDASAAVRTEVSNAEIQSDHMSSSQEAALLGPSVAQTSDKESYSARAAIISCLMRQYFSSKYTHTNESDRAEDDQNVLKYTTDTKFTVESLAAFPRALREAVLHAQDVESWNVDISHAHGGDSLGTACLSAFGTVLYYLQRCLIEHELLSTKKFAVYSHDQGILWDTMPANNNNLTEKSTTENTSTSTEHAVDAVRLADGTLDVVSVDAARLYSTLQNAPKLVMDANTLLNLEILENSYDGGRRGTLLAVLDSCRSAFGKRVLREWITRPLTCVTDIEQRLCAVENLMGQIPCDGPKGQKFTLLRDADLIRKISIDIDAVRQIREVADECREILGRMPDLERLLARIHRNSSTRLVNEHPDARAIMYELETYSKRKIKDLTAALRGFEHAQKIRTLFSKQSIRENGLVSSWLYDIVQGALPDLTGPLRFFASAFDAVKAEKDGHVVPRRGVDDIYDSACDEIKDIEQQFEEHKKEQEELLSCKIGFIHMNKDRYQLEVPEQAAGRAPHWYEVKGQRKGKNAVRRFWTPTIRRLLEQIVAAEEKRELALRDSTRRLFERFDHHRGAWSAATTCVAFLDALLALAYWSEKGDAAGPMCRPNIVRRTPSSHNESQNTKQISDLHNTISTDWSHSNKPFLQLTAGRHPCITAALRDGSASTLGFADYIPNDVILGCPENPTGSASVNSKGAPCVLLTGPNMGGKSTLLRQTCMATLLAQIGAYVPAEQMTFTPADRIFTRVGASDRILAGQSTFFVELSETSTILRDATQDSLVILDELGRGTSTFDGNAIAFAVTKYLTEQIGARSLFATHYHTLCEEFENDPKVAMGHMACLVNQNDKENSSESAESVTFLYKFQEGACPKSYGLNVARLARLPENVILRANEKSAEFESSLDSILAAAKRTTPVGTKRAAENEIQPPTDIIPKNGTETLAQFQRMITATGQSTIDQAIDTLSEEDLSVLVQQACQT